jgi:cytochrome c biogenesis protein CcdA
VPTGYHLYANPLGPGIGKPLNLFVNLDEKDARNPWSVTWIEARKSVPKRYNPQIGSWVWAYQWEAFFFLRGVLTKDSVNYNSAAEDSINAKDVKATVDAKNARGGKAAANAKTAVKGKTGKAAAGRAKDTVVVPPVKNSIKYRAIIDALICRTACVPIEKSIAFELSTPSAADSASDTANITDNPALAFPGAPNWQSRYAKSEPMEFKIGAPIASPLVKAGNDTAAPQTGINLDLSGLSTGLPPPQSPVPDNQYGQYGEYGSAFDGGSTVWDYSPLEDRREYSLLTAILFALLAGLALNVTPCIFPMLGVRVLSFAESARESRRTAVARSAAFSGGIVAVFLLLAACAAFAGFSWGQQFQSPGTMVVIIAVIFLFALGMFDFYTLSVPQAVSDAGRKAGPTLTGDFLKGAAATVMATPCGGPFLGALLAWALLQRPLTIFVLFAMMGVGMAIPYVLLASSKRLMALLPKPGRWIEDFKHAMGFLLLLFAVNLLRSLDPRLTVTAVGICVSILCAASVNKRFAPFGAPPARRAAVIFTSIALIAVGAALSVKYLRNDSPLLSYGQDEPPAAAAPAQWQEFSPQALAAAHKEGRSAIVNFTASWCTNCKLNKAAALNADSARILYAQKNVLLLTADITNKNHAAQSLLHHLGSRSVPFLAIFPGDSPKSPVIMRDILSKDKYLAELRELP